MKSTLFLAVAIAGALTVTVSAQAGSPKGNAWAEAHQKVAGTTPDMLDRSVKQGSPKASQWAEAHKAVPSTGRDVDYANARRPTLSPKDSRYDMVWHENAVQDVQIAPLK
jgi:hypothetical protein